jgi:hypothetical protein
VALQRDEVDAASYTGGASDLAPGRYRIWLAAPTLLVPPAARSFTVDPPASERAALPMDAVDLQKAAEASQGRYYTVRNADRLPGDLPRGQRVRIDSLPPVPVWNSPLAALLFVALLTVEWVLRKRAGLL